MYHYSLNGALLKITCSDSQQEHVHEGRLPGGRGGRKDGRKREYQRQFNDSDISKEWRQKLGKELAVRFLLKPDNIDYFLANFPKGYILYSDALGVNHVKDRVDMYLYNDYHRFRSPAEFVPHAAWLIAGMPPERCKCKYCGRGPISQTKLNKELESGYKEAMDNEAKKRQQAAKNRDGYKPRDLPLEEVFLKPVEG